MADDVPAQVEGEIADDDLEGDVPQTNAQKAQALASNIKIPDIDFNDPNRQSLAPRGSRDGKVFTNGFKITGFNSMIDLPHKLCVDCGFHAMKFSTACPKCGGELSAES